MNQVADKPAATSRMSLDNIKSSGAEEPLRIIIYGAEGIGKTTLAADAPSPVFLGAEKGTNRIKKIKSFPQPLSWDDIMSAVEFLTNGAHDYQTLVLDTLDSIEPLCWAHVVQHRRKDNGQKVKDIESFGFGKGYDAALDYWREFAAAVERLADKRRMHVIMIAHEHIRTFKNPDGEDYDRHEMQMHKKAASFLRQRWAEAVLFAEEETVVKTDKRTKKSKGLSTGLRVLHTVGKATYQAKNRYGLPERLPLEWSDLYDAILAGQTADPSALRAAIESMLLQSTDETLADKVTKAVAAAFDNAAQLSRIKNKLAVVLSAQHQHEDEETEES